MSKLKKFSLCAFALFWAITAQAQYYSWGDDPVSTRWKQLKTPEVKLIYPDYYEANARRMLWYMDTVRTHIDFGFRHGTMRTPAIMHTQNTMGNGMVMWAPRRIELLGAPGASYSEPWLKQLIFHEYRHNVQYNNLRRGTNKVLTWFLGEQIAFLGIGQFSIYILEGDATMAETELSAFGRGLQPSWTMHYRAMGDVGPGKGRSDNRFGKRGTKREGTRRYALDYWFCGSIRDFVPDHYRIGYQMSRWSYNNFDKFIWDDMAHYVARNPQFIVPLTIGLKKSYGLNLSQIYRRTFADLNAYWDSLPEVENSSERIPTPETSYTTYRSPQWLGDSTLVAFKSDFDHYNRIVKVNVRTGEEHTLAHTGIVSSEPVLRDGKLWWTEYRSSLLWDQKTTSRICYYDLATDKKGVLKNGDPRHKNSQLLFPAPLPHGAMACVAYDYSGQFSIIERGNPDEPDGVWETLVKFPLDIELTSLAWDEGTAKLYFIGLDDGGMFLGAVEPENSENTPETGAVEPEVSETTEIGKGNGEGNCNDSNDSDKGNDTGFRRLTPSRHITISNLTARGGKLYFGSIASGKDEAHCYDLASGTEYRLSSSKFGSFQPSPSPDTKRIALTTYDRYGYHLTTQSTSTAIPQEQRTLPLDIVNPPWKRWDVPKMDSLKYTPADSIRSAEKVKPKKYRKWLNLFQPHSWLPINFYPPGAIQEMDLTISLGATVLSQNLLSDMTSWLAYGWSRRGGHLLRGGAAYSGLGPVLSVDFQWGGGTQTLYTPVPATTRLKKYFSVSAGVSVPMVLSSGYWHGSLSPSASYFYTNGLIFEPAADGLSGVLTRGVERLNFSVTYSGQTRMAQKEFLPRWGIAARVSYIMNPTNRDFHSLVSTFVAGYLPGVVRPHSITLRASWQQAVGNGRYGFQMKELFPRGAELRTASASNLWASGSIDYQLPVWYPEGGIPRVLYFKRVRLNFFLDYARWRGHTGTWSPLFSYGGDVILDISPLRMPASTNVALKFTIAKPSDRRGVFFGFGIDMPI